MEFMFANSSVGFSQPVPRWLEIYNNQQYPCNFYGELSSVWRSPGQDICQRRVQTPRNGPASLLDTEHTLWVHNKLFLLPKEH